MERKITNPSYTFMGFSGAFDEQRFFCLTKICNRNSFDVRQNRPLLLNHHTDAKEPLRFHVTINLAIEISQDHEKQLLFIIMICHHTDHKKTTSARVT